MTKPAAEVPGSESTATVGAVPTDLPPDGRALRLGLLVTATLVVLDQAAKELAETVLVPGVFVPWLAPRVGWQLVYNPGGAWGVPAPSWLFLIVTVIVTVIVLRTLPKIHSLLQATAYGMLLSGALGNVLDRLFRAGDDHFGGGWVVDFVAWGTFPRFNVADSAITVGFVLLVIALWREERRLEALGEPAADVTPGADAAHAGPAAPSGHAGPAAPAEPGADAGPAVEPDGPDDATPR